jgi:hypothetical protein
MTDPVPLPEGTLVAGRLRVVRLLAQGGMGAVYEGEHAFTKHRRALKLLHADMLEHPNVVARFLHEASAAGSASGIGPKPAVAPTSSAATKVPAKAANTRVDQRGLVGDNPF